MHKHLKAFCYRKSDPYVVLDTKTEWRVLIDNLPPGNETDFL